MYIMGENPIISDPDIAHAEHWFRELEFLAVQDLFLTETARYADVVLPGVELRREERDLREHRAPHPAVAPRPRAPPGEARGDLEILIDLSRPPRPSHAVSRRPEDVMREIARGDAVVGAA